MLKRINFISLIGVIALCVVSPNQVTAQISEVKEFKDTQRDSENLAAFQAQFNKHAIILFDRRFEIAQPNLVKVQQAINGIKGLNVKLKGTVVGHSGRFCRLNDSDELAKDLNEDQFSQLVCDGSAMYQIAVAEIYASEMVNMLRKILVNAELDVLSMGQDKPLHQYPEVLPRNNEELTNWNAIAASNNRVELKID